jgi:hypothetical protein
MRIPIWLMIGVAVVVIVFGVYRIRLAFRSDAVDARAKERGGLYGMGRRTHALVGIIYLLLGSALVATAFGWNPFGGLFGPQTEEPTKDTAPTKTPLPQDGVKK